MADEATDTNNPAQPILEQDSAATKAEKVERNGAVPEDQEINAPLSPRKRAQPEGEAIADTSPAKRQKGVASVKAESVACHLTGTDENSLISPKVSTPSFRW
jgi:tRNA-dihydrouridine synthase 3